MEELIKEHYSNLEFVAPRPIHQIIIKEASKMSNLMKTKYAKHSRLKTLKARALQDKYPKSLDASHTIQVPENLLHKKESYTKPFFDNLQQYKKLQTKLLIGMTTDSIDTLDIDISSAKNSTLSLCLEYASSILLHKKSLSPRLLKLLLSKFNNYLFEVASFSPDFTMTSSENRLVVWLIKLDALFEHIHDHLNVLALNHAATLDFNLAQKEKLRSSAKQHIDLTQPTSSNLKDILDDFQNRQDTRLNNMVKNALNSLNLNSNRVSRRPTKNNKKSNKTSNKNSNLKKLRQKNHRVQMNTSNRAPFLGNSLPKKRSPPKRSTPAPKRRQKH